MFKKLFLPVGLIIAIISALVLPDPGIFLKRTGAVPVFIIIIFLLNGWNLKLRESNLNRSFLCTFIAAIIISLGLGPFIGMAAVAIFNLGALATVGIIVMSSVPVTLSSATVVTEVSGGNSLWALFMTIGLNIVGIFTVPFMVKLGLEDTEGVDISAGKLLLKLLLLVLLPFLAGYVLKKAIRAGTHVVLRYVPSICVILTVYAACGASRGTLMNLAPSEYPLMLGIVLGIHAALFVIAYGYGCVAKLDKPEKKALAFVSSQKTLPIALSVISVLPGDSGAAVIPCLLFHFTQLLVDSFVAAHMSHNADKFETAEISMS